MDLGAQDQQKNLGGLERSPPSPHPPTVGLILECMPTFQEYEKETTETVRGLFEEVDELFYREEHLANPKSSVQASF